MKTLDIEILNALLALKLLALCVSSFMKYSVRIEVITSYLSATAVMLFPRTLNIIF